MTDSGAAVRAGQFPVLNTLAKGDQPLADGGPGQDRADTGMQAEADVRCPVDFRSMRNTCGSGTSRGSRFTPFLLTKSSVLAWQLDPVQVLSREQPMLDVVASGEVAQALLHNGLRLGQIRLERRPLLRVQQQRLDGGRQLRPDIVDDARVDHRHRQAQQVVLGDSRVSIGSLGEVADDVAVRVSPALRDEPGQIVFHRPPRRLDRRDAVVVLGMVAHLVDGGGPLVKLYRVGERDSHQRAHDQAGIRAANSATKSAWPGSAIRSSSTRAIADMPSR